MSSSTPRASVAVLGPLSVTGPGGPVRLRPAQARVLAILLLEPDAELSRDVLIDRMWGESAPATAVTSLQVHVSAIRRVLPELVVTTPRGYRVSIERRGLDRAQFEVLGERASAAARSGDWPAALQSTARALRLWRGTPYEELRHDDYATLEINRLSERRLNLLELRARALLELGRTDEAIVRLRELVRHHPLREPLWEQLMLALYRAGRRAEALRVYQDLRQTLAEELDVEPGQSLRQLEERMLAGDPHLGLTATGQAVGNLPTTQTSFVGREDDVQRLVGLLSAERLVTIVGGPGMGKTRLAVETGHALVDAKPGGVWFASLAEARNPLEVVGRIVGATGLREHARSVGEVVRRLAQRPALLILDNCEHQLETCAEFVRQALAAGGELGFLLTSRRPLGVPGEQLWHVAPLPSPTDDAAETLQPASASAAVRLFVDRARAVDRGFSLSSQTAHAVAELCRRAEGIPLVLELAARWIQALGLDDIAEMLQSEPPGSPAGEVDHHRSLAAAIEWSMALLPPEDRRLFILTALFNGRFALDDIRAVCAPGQDRRRLARAVAGLVEASLVVVERQPDGTALYRMLAPIRDFARTRFSETVDWSAAREWLAAHYLAKPYADGGDPLRQVVDLEEIDRDIDNIRQAVEIGVELGRADEVARLLVRTEGYWLNRYLVAERSHWLRRALEQIGDPLSRAHALRSLGSSAQVLGELDRSLAYFEQALPIFRQLDDRHGLAHGLLSLSGLLAMRGAWAEGVAAAQEAGRIAAELDSTSGKAIAAYYVGENHAYAGDLAAAIPQLREAARLFEEAGELGRASYALSTLTKVAALAGDEQVARQYAPLAMALAEESKSVYRRVRALGSVGLVEARFGDADTARHILLETHALMEPYELDDLFLVLLPAAFLLRRCERWQLLTEVLDSCEAAIAESGSGYPEPWRAVVEMLRRDAILAASSANGPPPPVSTRRLELVTADVLNELAS